MATKNMITDKAQDYVPYGAEWEKEMSKFSKPMLIQLLKKEYTKPAASTPPSIEQRSKEEKYRANFLWGFEDDSIESLGYELANGKTEAYLKEIWDALVEKLKGTEQERMLTVEQGSEIWDAAYLKAGHDHPSIFDKEEKQPPDKQQYFLDRFGIKI